MQLELVPEPHTPASACCRFCGRRLTDPLYVGRRAGRVCGGPARARRLSLAPPAHAGLDHEVPVVDGQLDLFDPTIPATTRDNQMEELMTTNTDSEQFERGVAHGRRLGMEAAAQIAVSWTGTDATASRIAESIRDAKDREATR